MKVVITTGTFNLITPAHVEYLRVIKSMGDRLVVFLDSDERNMSLKGHKAVLDFNERREILESIRYVDFTEKYTGPTDDFEQWLDRTISGVGSILFVKGGYNHFDELDPAQVKLLRSKKIPIVLIDKLPGVSTSDIVFRIRDSIHPPNTSGPYR
jgi:cytidyltransferase-like protein